MAQPRMSGVLDAGGRPVSSEAVARARQGGRRASLNGGGNGWAFPYDAASFDSPELGNWYPWLTSPDTEINYNRDRMVARQRDLVRNEGIAAGLVNKLIDTTIGGYYRLVSKPDYRALQARFGGKFDMVWATEYRQAAEARWRSYSEDPGHYNDVTRQMTVTQQLRLGLRHKLVDGEDLFVRYWLPQRIGSGAARYATAFLCVDPDRLSNPQQQPDTKFMRSGVEIDTYGAPAAYHIRKAHQNDWYNAAESMQWDRVLREDEDGFQRVIHDYDRDRAGQSRGVSIFAPVLTRLKMLARYYGLKLQQENILSTFGTYVTSPYDRQMIEEALSDDDDEDRISLYAGMREGFHDRNPIHLNEARIPQLAPGESIETVGSDRPPGEMTPFAHEMMRVVGSATGVSGEQVTGDYSEVNFSSMRVGIVNSEKTAKRRIADFNTNTATPIYAGWLHEAHEAGDMGDVLPQGAPSFMDAKVEYSRSRWLGAPLGWYDPVAERQGKVLGLDAGFETLESVCAEQGSDWEENLDQRSIELQRCRDLNIPPPRWFGDGVTAAQAAQKPQKPEAA